MQLPKLPPGSTALHVACRRLRPRCVALLLAAGADCGIRDERGFAPVDVLHESPAEAAEEEEVNQQQELQQQQRQLDGIATRIEPSFFVTEK